MSGPQQVVWGVFEEGQQLAEVVVAARGTMAARSGRAGGDRDAPAALVGGDLADKARARFAARTANDSSGRRALDAEDWRAARARLARCMRTVHA